MYAVKVSLSLSFSCAHAFVFEYEDFDTFHPVYFTQNKLKLSFEMVSILCTVSLSFIYSVENIHISCF